MQFSLASSCRTTSNSPRDTIASIRKSIDFYGNNCTRRLLKLYTRLISQPDQVPRRSILLLFTSGQSAA
jgi:hypothetical protein